MLPKDAEKKGAEAPFFCDASVPVAGSYESVAVNLLAKDRRAPQRQRLITE
jgi:hypothetical protein